MKILFLFVLSLVSLKADPFFADKSRGWHWYEELPIEEEEVKDPEKKETQAAEKTLTAKEKLAQYRKQLEESLAQAILEPTQQNIRSYQTRQQEMMQRSQTFSQNWMKNVMTIPQLDYSLQFPTNQMARHEYLDQERKQNFEVIKSLSQEYGLFFFFSGGCGYCHKFSPIVKEFSDRYAWDVLAISLDGSVLPEFPEAVPDNGLSQQWKIEVLPSLYAVNPKTGHVIAVAHGLSALNEIEDRIIAQVKK